MFVRNNGALNGKKGKANFFIVHDTPPNILSWGGLRVKKTITVTILNHSS